MQTEDDDIFDFIDSIKDSLYFHYKPKSIESIGKNNFFC